jgi:transglutaminase-like putative cysteine protease
MSLKTGSYLLVVIGVVLGLELYYLKTLPGSFVRVHYAHEVNDFNQPPTEAMTVARDGTVFDYRIPHTIQQDTFDEITEAIQETPLDSMERVLLVAQWVRSTVQFAGGIGYTTPGRPEEHLGDVNTDVVRGLCDFYSRLFVITCQELGIVARIIELDGHVVPEAFLQETARWVMIDPTFGYYMLRGNDPLSVVELIQCYRSGRPLTPAVFAKGKGDDCLYSAEDEITLREIYLNGFTVVSNQQVDYTTIRETLLKTFTVPVVKVQFMDSNSTMIGARERALRYSIVVTALILCMVAIATVLAKR